MGTQRVFKQADLRAVYKQFCRLELKVVKKGEIQEDYRSERKYLKKRASTLLQKMASSIVVVSIVVFSQQKF